MKVSNQLKEPNQFILKYRFNFFLTLCTLVIIGVLLPFTLMLVRQHLFFGLLMSCFLLFLLVSLASQILLPQKAFHFLVDRQENKLLISYGLRSARELLLSDLQSVALRSYTYRGSTSYYLQFATTPEIWCQFNKKMDKLQQYTQEYEALYLVIVANNQKDAEMNQLVDFLAASGISKRPFVKAVLGRYPGVPRLTQEQKFGQAENQIVTKQNRRQRIGRVGQVIFTIFAIIYLLAKLLQLFG